MTVLDEPKPRGQASKTPPNPPLSGGEDRDRAPSPDKGRAGEGFAGAGPTHPSFLSYNAGLTRLARQNRAQATPAEQLLWQRVLRGRQFGGHKFLRQKPIGPYIVDFYSPALRLVVEVDGDSHAEQVTYDQVRSEFLQARGLRVCRYSNRDVLHNLEGVFQDLSRFLTDFCEASES